MTAISYPNISHTSSQNSSNTEERFDEWSSRAHLINRDKNYRTITAIALVSLTAAAVAATVSTGGLAGIGLGIGAFYLANASIAQIYSISKTPNFNSSETIEKLKNISYQDIEKKPKDLIGTQNTPLIGSGICSFKLSGFIGTDSFFVFIAPDPVELHSSDTLLRYGLLNNKDLLKANELQKQHSAIKKERKELNQEIKPKTRDLESYLKSPRFKILESNQKEEKEVKQKIEALENDPRYAKLDEREEKLNLEWSEYYNENLAPFYTKVLEG